MLPAVLLVLARLVGPAMADEPGRHLVLRVRAEITDSSGHPRRVPFDRYDFADGQVVKVQVIVDRPLGVEVTDVVPGEPDLLLVPAEGTRVPATPLEPVVFFYRWAAPDPGETICIRISDPETPPTDPAPQRRAIENFRLRTVDFSHDIVFEGSPPTPGQPIEASVTLRQATPVPSP